MTDSHTPHPGATLNKRFPTLVEAYNYANGLIAAGVTMQPSRVFQDRIRASRRNRFLLLLGVERNAAAFCARMAPGGTWGVEVECPGTPYETVGLLGMRTAHTQHHRCSAWYSRYLPYAYAMMKAESNFRCLGVDFASINSYYGTCMGFANLTQGDDDPRWSRLEPEDHALYNEVYSASMSIRPPELPFYAVLGPALAYTAIFRPDLVAAHTDRDNWQWRHVCEVFEHLGRPRPVHSTKRPPAQPDGRLALPSE
jgi:hypothetical protein